jgi:nucleotide-binding universal stress UspA family protein
LRYPDDGSDMRVLLGMNGSEAAFDALDGAIERAQVAGDDVTVAVLTTPATTYDPDEIEARVRETLDEADFDADVVRLSGDPGSELVELAESEEYDRVVLGGGERSPLGKITLGEVAEFVLLNAETSVTLVR